VVRRERGHGLAARPRGDACPGAAGAELLYAAAIIFFCFSTRRCSTTRRRRGQPEEVRRVHPGLPAGDQTAKYIEKITLRLTLLGSLYLVTVCFIPNFLIAWKNVPFYFGGTSLLIIVVVTMTS